MKIFLSQYLGVTVCEQSFIIESQGQGLRTKYYLRILVGVCVQSLSYNFRVRVGKHTFLFTVCGFARSCVNIFYPIMLGLGLTIISYLIIFGQIFGIFLSYNFRVSAGVEVRFGELIFLYKIVRVRVGGQILLGSGLVSVSERKDLLSKKKGLGWRTHFFI